MRKLIYVSPEGVETGSWNVAKTWKSYTIRLDEMPEQISDKERERRARRRAIIAAKHTSPIA